MYTCSYPSINGCSFNCCGLMSYILPNRLLFNFCPNADARYSIEARIVFINLLVALCMNPCGSSLLPLAPAGCLTNFSVHGSLLQLSLLVARCLALLLFSRYVMVSQPICILPYYTYRLDTFFIQEPAGSYIPFREKKKSNPFASFQKVTIWPYLLSL